MTSKEKADDNMKKMLTEFEEQLIYERGYWHGIIIGVVVTLILIAIS